MPVPPRLTLESVMPKILACTMPKHYVVGEVGLTDVEIQCGRWGTTSRLFVYGITTCVTAKQVLMKVISATFS